MHPTYNDNRKKKSWSPFAAVNGLKIFQTILGCSKRIMHSPIEQRVSRIGLKNIMANGMKSVIRPHELDRTFKGRNGKSR